MKGIVVVFFAAGLFTALLMMSGCAANSALNVDYSAISQLSNRGNLEVNVICNSPRAKLEKKKIEDEVIAKLRDLNAFDHIYTKESAGSYKSDIRLDLTVVSIKRVTKAARLLVGSMAGRGKIKAIADIFDLHTKMKVGRATVEGETSGGTALAGTTEQAISQMAEALASIFRNKVFKSQGPIVPMTNSVNDKSMVN